jgi:hypothetical protein
VALVALVTPAAHAAAKPACHIITDPAGDTFAVRTQNDPPAGDPHYGPQDDSLDVVSGDLASDGKVVTAVIRIKKLSRTVQTSPTGITASLGFLIGGSDTVVRLYAVLTTGQTDRFEVSAISSGALANTPATYVGDAHGVVDLAKNEIRITALGTLLAPYGTLKPGTPLFPNENESATVGRNVPSGTKTQGQPMTTRGPFADIAAGGKAIKVGAPSCVVPGK